MSFDGEVAHLFLGDYREGGVLAQTNPWGPVTGMRGCWGRRGGREGASLWNGLCCPYKW